MIDWLSVWQPSRSGIWGHAGAWVLWVLLLALPFIYFRIPSIIGIELGIAVALLPIIVGGLVSLWSVIANRRNDTEAIRHHTDTFSAIFTLLGVTSVYLWVEPAPGVPELAALWGVGGFTTGLAWRSLYERKSPYWPYLRFTVWLFFAIAVIRAGIDFWRHGAAGAMTGVAMIVGLGFGFVLGNWLKLLQRFQDTWQDFKRYGGHFSTFIVGYIAIVYIFAGLYAALWQYEKQASFGPPFPPSYSGFADFLFFSLVTVTTLGSDINARTPLAKVLVSVEVLTGLFWITVVINIILKGVGRPDERSPKNGDRPPDA